MVFRGKFWEVCEVPYYVIYLTKRASCLTPEQLSADAVDLENTCSLPNIYCEALKKTLLVFGKKKIYNRIQ